MRARYRRKQYDDDEEHGARGKRVAKKLQRDILGQALSHDSGTDDCCEQNRGAEHFRRETAEQRSRLSVSSGR